MIVTASAALPVISTLSSPAPGVSTSAPPPVVKVSALVPTPLNVSSSLVPLNVVPFARTSKATPANASWPPPYTFLKATLLSLVT